MYLKREEESVSGQHTSTVLLTMKDNILTSNSIIKFHSIMIQQSINLNFYAAGLNLLYSHEYVTIHSIMTLQVGAVTLLENILKTFEHIVDFISIITKTLWETCEQHCGHFLCVHSNNS